MVEQDMVLKMPFFMNVVGPRRCGKTMFVKQVVEQLVEQETSLAPENIWFFDSRSESPFKRIQELFQERQAAFTKAHTPAKGFASEEEERPSYDPPHMLIVLDDLPMPQVVGSPNHVAMLQILSARASLNISCIVAGQKLYLWEDGMWSLLHDYIVMFGPMRQDIQWVLNRHTPDSRLNMKTAYEAAVERAFQSDPTTPVVVHQDRGSDWVCRWFLGFPSKKLRVTHPNTGTSAHPPKRRPLK